MGKSAAASIQRLTGLNPGEARRYLRFLGKPTQASHTEDGVDFSSLSLLRRLAGLRRDGISARRISRALKRFPQQAALLSHHGKELTISHQGQSWNLETGQLLLPWDENAGEARVVAMPPPIEPPADSPEVWFDVAVALEEIDPIKAEETYLKVLAHQPAHPEALINLGRLCSVDGRNLQAQAYFQEALELDPNQATAHYNLGVILHDAGHLEEAARSYLESLRLEPSFADAHFNLAALLETQGDGRGALRHMAEYRRLRPNSKPQV